MSKNLPIPPDLREFLELLHSHDVQYVIVGAMALAFHSHPRYTGDADFFVGTGEPNAGKLVAALRQFGFGSLDISTPDLTTPNRVIQLEFPPNRIDILTSISAVDFDQAWAQRETLVHEGVELCFISKDLLKRNKQAVGRPQDLADLEKL